MAQTSKSPAPIHVNDFPFQITAWQVKSPVRTKNNLVALAVNAEAQRSLFFKSLPRQQQQSIMDNLLQHKHQPTIPYSLHQNTTSYSPTPVIKSHLSQLSQFSTNSPVTSRSPTTFKVNNIGQLLATPKRMVSPLLFGSTLRINDRASPCRMRCYSKLVSVFTPESPDRREMMGGTLDISSQNEEDSMRDLICKREDSFQNN